MQSAKLDPGPLVQQRELPACLASELALRARGPRPRLLSECLLCSRAFRNLMLSGRIAPGWVQPFFGPRSSPAFMRGLRANGYRFAFAFETIPLVTLLG